MVVEKVVTQEVAVEVERVVVQERVVEVWIAEPHCCQLLLFWLADCAGCAAGPLCYQVPVDRIIYQTRDVEVERIVEKLVEVPVERVC